MSKLVELYVREVQRPDSGVTMEDVPTRLRAQVAEAIAAMAAETGRESAPAE